ncbi:MAG: osmoprotectant ABC transporter substrate-binding protein [Tissierellia bacterium]|nr:osmoprotectant ABC transporter substrate-binding protein [Tissierellia bacterium]
MKYKKILFLNLTLILLLILSSCSLPGLETNVKSDGIIVASGNMTERQVLSEIVVQMIEYYMPEQKPGLINNLGSSMLIFQSIEREDANIGGGMYTGTSLTGELGMDVTTDPKEAFNMVINGYSEKFNMVWFPSYGFENTYAFMTSRKFAEENNIEKVSDLEKLKDTLRVGVDTTWIDRDGDGYDSFQELYGFEFEHITPMEIGLVYDAINSEKMHVALGYSTDGRINAYDLVLLKDDLHLFPPYDCSAVITKNLLRVYPELETIILKLEGEIDSETMQKLNRLSDEMKIEPNIVARDFLKEHNYFEDKNPIPLSEREEYIDIIKDVLPLQGGN